MRRVRSHGIAVLGGVVGLLASGCQCAERPYYDTDEPSGTTGLYTTTAAEVETAAEASTTQATEEPGDPSRFFGVFHYEGPFVHFGVELPSLAGEILANVYIRPDGTAGMMTEFCSESSGTIETEWNWALGPDQWLELTPGPGEESLRWMARTDLESLRATIDDQCELLFEVDGVLKTGEVYRPGEACWVNRCEFGKVHIDYCDEESPPSCE